MYISVQSVSDAWWLSAKRSASDTVAKRKDWGLDLVPDTSRQWALVVRERLRWLKRIWASV